MQRYRDEYFIRDPCIVGYGQQHRRNHDKAKTEYSGTKHNPMHHAWRTLSF
jgi:hypothetical protein